MKSLKLTLLKIKFISILLCIILSFSCVLFSSCTLDNSGTENKTFFENYIDSFKVVYSNSLEGNESCLIPLQNDFFFNTLSVPSYGLAYYYGSGNEINAVANPNWFPDSIRMCVIKDASGNAELISNNIWKWTFSQNLDETNYNDANYLFPSQNEKYNMYTYIEEGDEYTAGWKYRLWNNDKNVDKKFSELYSTTFNNMYLMPLKIVMYEILLGYDKLTTFAPATIVDVVNDNQAGLIAKVIDSGESLIKGNLVAKDNETSTVNEEELSSQNLKDYLIKLKEDFLKKTKYIGFTKENADKMISYILDEVIGTELVNYDYITYGPGQTNYVQEISKNKADFKAILGLAVGQETDSVFDNYVSKLEIGDVIYNPNGYNYLVYNGTSGTGSSTQYNFEDYYNYRNYVERVANIIYKQTYDGTSENFIYTRNISSEAVTAATIEYDFVKANKGVNVIPNIIEQGEASATAATFLKDFNGEAFFEKSSIGNDEQVFGFGTSPKAEYQSILMMVKPGFVLEAGMIFNILAYDPNLQINIKVRYYYHETHTLIEFDNGKTVFANSEVVYDPVAKMNGYQTDFEIGFDLDRIPASAKGTSGDGYETFEIPVIPDGTAKDSLNTDGDEYNLGLKDEDVSEEKEISQDLVNKCKEASKYYKVIDSQNGYGGLTVLDESIMQCSFFEIVFDVVKSPTDPANMDYDFKITISPFIW